MAADETGVASAHFTLTANTAKKVNLTGKTGRKIEVVHTGNVTDPLYVTVARTEAALVTAVKAADETDVVCPYERLPIQAPSGNSVWVSVICNGAATVAVIGSR